MTNDRDNVTLHFDLTSMTYDMTYVIVIFDFSKMTHDMIYIILNLNLTSNLRFKMMHGFKNAKLKFETHVILIVLFLQNNKIKMLKYNVSVFAKT